MSQRPAVIMNIAYPGLARGFPSDVDVSFQNSTIFGAGFYDGWSADRDLTLASATAVRATVYSVYEDQAAIRALYPDASTPNWTDNLDEVNWLLNQNYTASKAYTWGDVQAALWTLLGDDPTGSTAIGSWKPANVAALVNAAHTHNGYVPDITDAARANDNISVLLAPVNAGGTLQQPVIIQVKSAALGDYVWADTNGNGVQDSGEAGVAGVTVNLWRDANNNGFDVGDILRTTTTDATGHYKFFGLPPGLDYQVQFVKPADYVFTRQDIGANDAVDSDANVSTGTTAITVLKPGQWNKAVDAGLIRAASLGDRLWLDTNGNGKQDIGEGGIAGQSVTLISGGADGLINGVGDTTAATVTGSDGLYRFTGLTPGQQYQVLFSKPVGSVFTAPNVSANTVDSIDSDADTASGKTQIVTLAAGANNTTLDAGVYTPAMLSGYVYQDVGNDGVRNAEPPIAGVTLKLAGTDGLGNAVTGTTTTDASGYYHFDNLVPGSYTVSETQPAAYADGKDTAGTAGGNATVNDVISSIALVSGTQSTENNFGELAPAPASLGDRVWLDVNANGLQDAGEPGLAGLAVALIGGGADGLINGVGDTRAEILTGADGLYSFTGLTPGQQYQVQFTKPFQALVFPNPTPNGFTAPNVNANGFDGIDSDADPTTGKSQIVTLASGENNTTLDAGIYNQANLSGYVYVDADNDGVRNAEPPIAGVTLKLTGTDGLGHAVSTTTTTDASGYYHFDNLIPGSYTVSETQPAAYADGKDTAGTAGGNTTVNDVISSITLVSRTISTENNFGELAPAPAPASLGDRVWSDDNGNGLQDAGELGLAGLAVRLIGGGADGLINGVGDTTVEMLTGAEGLYSFTGLTPGQQYQVQFTTPAQLLALNTTTYVFTAPNVNANGLDSIDSDADTTTGTSQIVTLASGENNATLDAGIYKLTTVAIQAAAVGVTPIVLDLNGDGIHTVALADATGSFDLFGNGSPIQSGWLSGSDGFLAVDQNGNGKIDSIAELFGGFAKGDGFAKLAAFDSNGDGLVDIKDSDFANLKIWQDLNGNHQTDSSELISLAQAGVSSLKVAFTEAPILDAQGNLHLEQSSATLANGHAVAMTDVYFNVAVADADAAGVHLDSFAQLLATTDPWAH